MRLFLFLFLVLSEPIHAGSFPNHPVVERDAVDVDCTPLPKSSRQVKTELLGSPLTLTNFRADAVTLQKYRQNVPETTWSKFTEQEEYLRKLGGTAVEACTSEELFAIIAYTGSSYQKLNSTLRQLKAGRVRVSPRVKPLDARCQADDATTEWQELAPETDLSIRVTASAVNCVAPVKYEVVFRGANLTPEQLRKYIAGRTIIERSFTSTSLGAIPDLFVGNVEFRIFDAVGATLAAFSPEREETEVLIQAGTLFKVLNVGEEQGQTIIDLRQIP